MQEIFWLEHANESHRIGRSYGVNAWLELPILVCDWQAAAVEAQPLILLHLDNMR